MRDVVALVVVIGVIVTSCSNGTSTTMVETDGTDGSATSITIPEDTEYGIVSGVVNGDTVEVMIGDESRVIRRYPRTTGRRVLRRQGEPGGLRVDGGTQCGGGR